MTNEPYSLIRLKRIVFDAWHWHLSRHQVQVILGSLKAKQHESEKIKDIELLKRHFEKTRWPLFLDKLEKLKIKKGSRDEI